MAQTTFDFDQMLSNAREAYGEELMRMADDGLDFVFTYSDNVAPSSSAGKFIQKYPDRCFNFGIAEPNQVGASAGLALSGEIVFAQVFGPFLSLRSADQIHTDIAYNDVNVRLIGTHAGVTAGGGPTHNCIADLALYRAIPNLTIVVPADAGQCTKMIRKSMGFQGPMVIRIDRGGSPNVYADNDYEIEFGKAIETISGNDLTLISAGSSVYWSMMGAKILKERHGISARVIDMHTIKPLDTEMIVKCAKETGTIVTVEEHSINGGLGAAVAECLCENGFGGNFKRIGLPDEFAVLGHPDEVYKYYGMDPEGIAKSVEELLNIDK
ncbi:transketolase C-terminal domain-containing protein [Petroclostridium sp. X23]|uniref:transketolase family protein n=1 Tax=Petroclostridium sp. X23 TaxID=3045146 RepID=UPI0024ACBED3|nr:transketolase C-terminal domain-containing protein [Petroclostridium sp. X23]WHH58203.1 transketolase C-terminal domain-containing protein [Petroclostridium sp. X23]